MAHQGHGIGAKAAAIFGEYYQRERDPAAYEPIYPGRGSVWSDKERLWIPEILNNRKEEHPNRTTVSGVGVQPQKEVDEAAKKKAGNPLFQEKSCVGNKIRKVFHRQTARKLTVSFAIP